MTRALPADSEALVRRAFERLAEDGVEAILPFVHERFEMSTPPELASEPDVYLGHDGVRRWFDSFYDAMDEVRLEPVELTSAGDEVAVWLRIAARGRTTSLELVQVAAALCKLDEGLVRRIRFYPSWEGLWMSWAWTTRLDLSGAGPVGTALRPRRTKRRVPSRTTVRAGSATARRDRTLVLTGRRRATAAASQLRNLSR